MIGGRLKKPRPLAQWGTAAWLAVCILATRANANPQWGFDANGRVLAIARSGNTIYCGGFFDTICQVTGGGAITPLDTGVPIASSPPVAGSVFAVLTDGAGGWFIGGSFTGVGGEARSNLAHILASGEVAEWFPNPDGYVLALARNGRTLYVGGAFTRVGGRARDNLAAVDCITGRASDWNPRTDQGVAAIVDQGALIYIGGYFTRVGARARAGLAAVRATDGSVSDWNPGAGGSVLCMCAYKDTIYAGGRFDLVGGVARGNLAAIDASGSVTSWNTSVFQVPPFRYLVNQVNALALQGSTLYVGGVFNQVAGVARSSIAALDLSSRSVSAWDPHGVQDFVPPSVSALGVQGTSLWVGGSFDSLGGVPLVDPTAMLDTRTGHAIRTWNARPNLIMHCFASDGRHLYIGGDFTSLGPLLARHNLAAFDATTGQPTPWDPRADYYVQALAVRGGKVFAGGAFSFVGGAQRRGLAEIDSTSGLTTAWNPACDGDVWTLGLTDSVIYVGGYFSVLGGSARPNAGAFRLETRELTQWNPLPNDIVSCLAIKDGAVFLGGDFFRVGPVPRLFLAAVDGAHGDVLAWNPHPDSDIEDIAIEDTTLYAGGAFSHIGGIPRRFSGAVSTRTGLPTAWRADTDGLVKSVAVSDGTVYLGGLFSSVEGVARANLGAVDSETGALRDWRADADQIVWTVESIGDRILAGGAFRRAGLSPASLLAVLEPYKVAGSGQPIAGASNVSGLTVTSPAAEATVIRYNLIRPAPVTMKVFDLLGRLVANQKSDGPAPAGFHVDELSTSRWRPGCYLMTVDGGGAVQSRKLVVVR